MEKLKGDETKSGESGENDSSGKGEAGESGFAHTEDEKGEARIAPVREKIGEGPHNLRRRSDWYQRRTGGSEGGGR